MEKLRLYEKIWYFGKNYDIIPKTMELSFNIKRNYGTIENKWNCS